MSCSYVHGLFFTLYKLDILSTHPLFIIDILDKYGEAHSG